MGHGDKDMGRNRRATQVCQPQMHRKRVIDDGQRIRTARRKHDAACAQSDRTSADQKHVDQPPRTPSIRSRRQPFRSGRIQPCANQDQRQDHLGSPGVSMHVADEGRVSGGECGAQSRRKEQDSRRDGRGKERYLESVDQRQQARSSGPERSPGNRRFESVSWCDWGGHAALSWMLPCL